MNHQTLTAVQEDYLEVILRLESESPAREIRISDIAARLGTRPPTVTRAVHRLVVLGLLHHPLRGQVRLSAQGHRLAKEIVHRHDDIVTFFTGILGVGAQDAELDACQIEHGLSARTAQRLHEFLEHFMTLTRTDKRLVTGFLKAELNSPGNFRILTRARGNGWRS